MTQRTNQHFPGLDGLRGIAILSVFFYHFSELPLIRRGLPEWMCTLFGLGWSGVDLFFVLSGFLITRILILDRENGVSLGSFYARRFLRIFPLYFGLLLGAAMVCFLFPIRAGGTFASLQKYPLLIAVNFSNFVPLISETGLGGLGHLWSLAIEEQFYFVWPFVLLVIPASQRRPLIALFIVGSFAARIGYIWQGHDPLWVYLATPGRLDGLLVGAFLAVHYLEGRAPRLPRATWGFALAAGIAAICIYRGSSHHTVLMESAGFTLLALFYGWWVWRAIQEPRPFHSGVLRFFGKYSYSIYLLHYPLFTLALKLTGDHPVFPATAPAWAQSVLCLVVSLTLCVVAALFTWKFVEAPALALKRFFPGASQKAELSPIR